MDELSRIVGKLEGFMDATERELSEIKREVRALNAFKYKATGIMVGIFAVIEIIWRAISSAMGK
jgi:hypothetical protein